MLICKLSQIILEKNLSIKTLSKLSGVKSSTIEKYISNQINKIHFSTLNKLCKTLNCNTSDLFEKH